MNALTGLWNRSGNATVEVARSSQAVLIQVADWSQRHWPSPVRRVVEASFNWLGSHVEEPARIAARPYRLSEELVTLHGEFTQRLLELADAPRVTGPDRERDDGVVVDFALAQRRHAAGG
jgi:hypothetical protein